MTIEEFGKQLKRSGVVGAGGAGFPTYAKLSNQAEVILLNCAECEPLLRLHRQLLEVKAYEILSTFLQVGTLLGAKRKIVCVKKSYHATIEAIKDFVKDHSELEVCELEDEYPAGDEVVLIYEATGIVVAPGGIPIQSKVAVFNVETMYNIHNAVLDHTPVIKKYISIVGEVKEPKTLHMPIGITVKELVELCGDITTKEPVYLMGGPMMGKIVGEREVITKTSNAILVLSSDHNIVRKKIKNTSIDLKRAASACCQCMTCTDLCPRHLLGHPVEPNKFMLAATCKDMQNTETYLNTMYCSSCGLCEMYSCQQGLSPRSLITEYKDGLRKAGLKPQRLEQIEEVQPLREYRKVPMKRLISRLGLSKYENAAPLTEFSYEPQRVKIYLSQHIGAPAECIVKKDDFVSCGQEIGKAQNGLSVAIHASISGRILEANEKYVIIEKSLLKGREQDE